jgi:hypothetical protein
MEELRREREGTKPSKKQAQPDPQPYRGRDVRWSTSESSEGRDGSPSPARYAGPVGDERAGPTLRAHRCRRCAVSAKRGRASSIGMRKPATFDAHRAAAKAEHAAPARENVGQRDIFGDPDRIVPRPDIPSGRIAV